MSQYISWPSDSTMAPNDAVDAVAELDDVKVERGPELTLSPSFTSRQPNARVSSSPQTSTHHFVTFDAISAQQNNTTSTARQHVHSSVNSASSNPVQRSYGQHKPSITTLETSVSSSSQSFNQHGLTKPPSSRLRTTVFQSSKDLAAHYGIPQFLPPAPRTTPKANTTPTSSRSSVQPGPQNQFPDFDSIKNSYLAMLSSKPQEATSGAAATADTANTASMAPPAAPASASATSNNDKEFQDLLSIIESPEFKDSLNQFTPVMDMDAYLTSPLPQLGHDFDESPRETPYHDFLSTPLFDALDPHSAYSSPLFNDAHDFDSIMNDPSAALLDYGASGLFNPPNKVPSTSAAASMPFDLDTLIPFTSPEHTMEDTFPAPLATPSSLPHSELPATSNNAAEVARRRPGATGTRKGITPDSLIPLDAPTQPRKYTTPSATSRKDVPAVFARKRARSQAFEGDNDGLNGDQDDDELARHEASPPGPNATEREQIEWKRRQNTLAARKSRKRKLEHQQRLEEDVRSLTRERDCWRTRAGVLQQLLVSHGVPFERWDDEE